MRICREKPSAVDGGRGMTVYSQKCDICGNFLMVKKGKTKMVGEFLSCGEDEIRAHLAGWILGNKIAICTDCLNSIGRQDKKRKINEER